MAHRALDDLDRLAALAQSGLMDSPPEPDFDRITRLIQRVLNVDVSLVSLVDQSRQFFKSNCGLRGADARGTPVALVLPACRNDRRRARGRRRP